MSNLCKNEKWRKIMSNFLTREQAVKDIGKMLASGRSIKDISNHYNVKQHTIRRLIELSKDNQDIANYFEYKEIAKIERQDHLKYMKHRRKMREKKKLACKSRKESDKTIPFERNKPDIIKRVVMLREKNWSNIAIGIYMNMTPGKVAGIYWRATQKGTDNANAC